MTIDKEPGRISVSAIQVHQWLDAWNEYNFDPAQHQSRPDSHFYLFALSAELLRTLSGVERRDASGGLRRVEDLGIQRRLDQERSDEIREFVQYGYPWSKLNSRHRSLGKYDELRKPGWLPTAVVVNILKPGDERRGRRLAPDDAITIEELNGSTAILHLPITTQGARQYEGLPPVEVIDGQHRLWAFDQGQPSGAFDLPVVAFYGLDFSWQAYLFWTINITPKRINPSLAYDLYPLLRAQDWLDRFEGPAVYRETRAQELVEILWSYPDSPWYQRINMLGEPGQGAVSQAAWIRAITSTFIRPWEGRGVRGIGGLYGAKPGQDSVVLPWARLQQAAFLIFLWQRIAAAVRSCNEAWAEKLRSPREQMALPDVHEEDPAFAGPYALLASDQGVRGILYITNDLFFVQYSQRKLDLEGWAAAQALSGTDDEIIGSGLSLLSNDAGILAFADELATGLMRFDWRSADEPSLTPDEKAQKLVFRGSGGYRELRRQLLSVLSTQEGQVAEVARTVIEILKV